MKHIYKTWFLCLILLPLTMLLSLANEAPAPFAIHIRCGGSGLLLPNGTQFVKDSRYTDELGYGYVEGNTAESTTSVQNTSYPQIYQGELWGVYDYQVKVPNGTYRVNLHFCEFYFTKPGQRVFDVSVEKQPVLKDFDIVQTVGPNTAYISSHFVKVEDEMLNISFDTTANQPKISAIEVFELKNDGQAPIAPQNIQVFEKENTVGLNWTPNAELDFLNYQILRSTSSEGPFEYIAKDIKDPCYLDTNLENGKTYYYQIQAQDFFNTLSQNNATIKATPLVRTPESIQIKISADDKIPSYHATRAYGMQALNSRDTLYTFDVPQGLYQIKLELPAQPASSPMQGQREIHINNMPVGLFSWKDPIPASTLTSQMNAQAGKLNIKFLSQIQFSKFEILPGQKDETLPQPPSQLNAHLNEFNLALTWQPSLDTDVEFYEIESSLTNDPKSKQLTKVQSSLWRTSDLKTEEYKFRIRSVDSSGNNSTWTEAVSVTPHAFSDDELLELIQKEAFYYFWNEANPQTGMVRDGTNKNYSSIAATGFGLASICVAVEHKWITKEAGTERALNTLKTLAEIPDNKKNGLFFHYLDMDGHLSQEGYEKTVSTIDTAILMCGVITAGQYFQGEIKKIADALFYNMNWRAFQLPDNGPVSMGWKLVDPKNINGAGELLSFSWSYYTDETILSDLLAISNPKNDYQIDPKVFYQFTKDWAGNKNTPRDYVYSWSGSLFTYQFAHLFVDFQSLGHDLPEKHGVMSENIDWFRNSKLAIEDQIRFCESQADKYKSFGPNSWGLSACIGPDNYLVAGAQPRGEGGDTIGDGTIAPYAAACSIIFVPERSKAALRHFMNLKFEGKDQKTLTIWKDHFDGGYGLADAFNIDRQFVADDYLAIDQGPMLIMIENYRTGLIQKLFMSHPAIQEGVKKIGFKKS